MRKCKDFGGFFTSTPRHLKWKQQLKKTTSIRSGDLTTNFIKFHFPSSKSQLWTKMNELLNLNGLNLKRDSLGLGCTSKTWTRFAKEINNSKL
jgi:hypothetical protein